MCSILKYPANRRANIIAGVFLTGVELVMLFVGTPTLAYPFFSGILIAISVAIVWAAWKMAWPRRQIQDVHVGNYEVGEEVMKKAVQLRSRPPFVRMAP